MQKHQYILKKAIDQLPSKKAPEDLWDSIVESISKDGLASMVDSLPTKKAPEMGWTEIDRQLQESSILRRSISELPQHELGEDLFDNILTGRKSISRRLWWVSGIAASFILIVSFAILMNQLSSLENISYSEELVEVDIDALDLVSEYDYGEDIFYFIENNCYAASIRCESDEFKDLFQLYKDLDETYQELKSEAINNADEIQLVTYLVELEKEKTEVGKQLITLIMS